jgi:iron complex transport system ATP-binding protein
MTEALGVKNLNVALGQRQVISDVTFSLEPGQFVGLIGPNGAGKSTLLRAMAGLLPIDGAISLSGQHLSDLAPAGRARLLSYLPQEREIAWPISVESVIALGRSPYRSALGDLSAEDRAAINRAIAAMDLDSLRTRSALELSGGERARVLIARALAQSTPILLADEPSAGLDPAHQISLMSTFSKLARDGRTVVASLHELTLTGQSCDRIILLAEGRIVADGHPSDVLTKDNLASVYGVRVHICETEAGLAVIPIGPI